MISRKDVCLQFGDLVTVTPKLSAPYRGKVVVTGPSLVAISPIDLSRGPESFTKTGMGCSPDLLVTCVNEEQVYDHTDGHQTVEQIVRRAMAEKLPAHVGMFGGGSDSLQVERWIDAMPPAEMLRFISQAIEERLK